MITYEDLDIYNPAKVRGIVADLRQQLTAAQAELETAVAGARNNMQIAEDYRDKLRQAQAEAQKWEERADKYKWQVRDTCTRAEKAEAEAQELRESSPDDLRAQGLTVAVHNDYRLNGDRHTFWLFTRADGMSFKGEGRSDAEALNRVRAVLSQPAEPCPKCGNGAIEQPTASLAENSKSLPLMARREWMPDGVVAARYDHKGQLCVGGSLDRAEFIIATHDEHGLPVVERTAEMPEGAKYRFYSDLPEDGKYCYVPSLNFIPRWAKPEHIEDFNEHHPATCTAAMPCTECDGGCVGEGDECGSRGKGEQT